MFKSLLRIAALGCFSTGAFAVFVAVSDQGLPADGRAWMYACAFLQAAFGAVFLFAESVCLQMERSGSADVADISDLIAIGAAILEIILIIQPLFSSGTVMASFQPETHISIVTSYSFVFAGLAATVGDRDVRRSRQGKRRMAMLAVCVSVLFVLAISIRISVVAFAAAAICLIPIAGGYAFFQFRFRGEDECRQ